MEHKWIPNSSNEIKKSMLDYIGVKDVLELYNDIPKEILINEKIWDNLGIGKKRPLDEIEVEKIIDDILNNNLIFKESKLFIGGGAWPHYIPAAVQYLAERGELLTAYTPYQPEISQGLLQILFEYQSLMADILEMDVVNASMYDMASSLGEAFLMSYRINNKKKILIPETINPFHLSVAKSYTSPHEISLVTYKVDPETGYADIEDLKSKSSDDISAIYLEYPYQYTGVVDVNAKSIGEIAHSKKALFIMGVNPTSLMIYKTPGELDADISIGEGQPLGLGLNFGGPYLGIFATKWNAEFVKQMPGRLIGMTTTIDGSSRAFAMIMQTREQHIRRSKATSNITTNSGLSAMIAAFYVSLLGKKGLKDVAEATWYRSHYASKQLSYLGFKSPLFKGEFFGDFIIDVKTNFEDLRNVMIKEGLLFGIPLSKYVTWAKDSWGLLSFTEVHSKSDIDLLLDKLKKIKGE
ncbi:glycine dehydrogenase [Caldisphaera sp.]|jgi:glycine dehydrogenase subunit 1|uniref:aminomethyl-transferring glycine dehydrogenase subunit GcvPA n=1 Tax=Caldisphaera sp. TaxID=2060322 RepID=UPI000CB2A023|nr:MAG: aminomethyl-transferring glycine dehydrogenase [Caldisphaera sp.]